MYMLEIMKYVWIKTDCKLHKRSYWDWAGNSVDDDKPTILYIYSDTVQHRVILKFIKINVFLLNSKEKEEEQQVSCPYSLQLFRFSLSLSISSSILLFCCHFVYLYYYMECKAQNSTWKATSFILIGFFIFIHTCKSRSKVFINKMKWGSLMFTVNYPIRICFIKPLLTQLEGRGEDD